MLFIIDIIDDDLAFIAVCYWLNTFTTLTIYSQLDDIYPTKFFFSAAGLCLQSGATCFHFDELALK
ncbi:hypothetical protein [Sodalis-like endosymbiont of Proechinophthirus fluctus]|uniref:hypothetical protein n=1 Tax=Sodalis-like endosymbiont of Proechinophthirus fluctus TaxID=1462730 RepID=UPI000829C3B3|nr:hypothetical protein [Sodalis-like endosymbiont of Proechinophthirus fluctus]